jgi:hypothetical protein
MAITTNNSTSVKAERDMGISAGLLGFDNFHLSIVTSIRGVVHHLTTPDPDGFAG